MSDLLKVTTKNEEYFIDHSYCLYDNSGGLDKKAIK